MILTTLLNIAIFQGIVISIVILRSPLFKSKANTYLALAIFTLSILLLNLVFELINLYEVLPSLEFIDDLNLELAFPVFLLLFIVHQVEHPLRHTNKVNWLFAPALLFSALNTVNNLDALFNLYQLPKIIVSIIEIIKTLEFFFTLIFIPSVLIYAFPFIKKSKDLNEKKWLTQLWLIVSTLMFSWVLTIVCYMFYDFDISLVMNSLSILASFMIHWTAYIGLYKFKLVKDQTKIEGLISHHSTIIYEVSATTNNDSLQEDKQETPLKTAHTYFEKLETLCRQHQIYKDSTLDRDKVAEMLGISSGYVSQLVNSMTDDNFTIYINGYRVQEVKDMIANPEFDNYSLLAIGLEAGFSSKTTFHNTFKKLTGVTPNTYKKAIK